jgi:hypothetical protein
MDLAQVNESDCIFVQYFGECKGNRENLTFSLKQAVAAGRRGPSIALAS